MEDISLPETLGGEEERVFNEYKKSIIDKIKSERNTADKQMVSRSKKGETTPEWSSALMWLSADDWSYSDTKEDTGYGYLQWKPIQAH